MDLNDTDLVTLAKAARGSAAFDTLVRRHQAALRAFLLRMSGNDALADDLAQETFIKAYRALDGFRGGASFRSWLFAIALRELAMDRRKATAQSRAAAAAADEDQHEDPTVGLSIDLQNALAALSAEERTAALLCDAAGFSHAEAAAAMSAPLGSVKTYVARAREKLKAALSVETPSTPSACCA
jgi:RNA polymerase sigma-70 factor (ECF subfamily)